ncbi:LTA synthase family protein [Clostridium chauvoei]|uniref:LTA synthase family protein n=3 Tax=Clostridium chauvoei TaxID=46867 RepID=A0ABD4RDZ7_9CLOT|nr:LTA synthase family protein [Clostridium chauvoei]ATD55016.1 hypothetical protein BTM20_07095 [Clostridium chauvoei]ATD57308.1 hypothetical protein BTM21_05960 [Clostridium chauvoei]MBX7279355.1 LTA synthase family protein [Clostridium chauvoei]MBX7283873.1 LTA synthase family protein [Clostridium chauvoei]MBX7285553.1 LTA synthase family protein [Clostridium chauvoei]
MKFLKDILAKGRSIVLLTFIFLLFKNILFLGLVAISGVAVNLDVFHLLFYSAFIMILIAPGYFLKEKSQRLYNISLNLIISLLLIFDLWYFRATNGFLGFKLIFFKDLINPFNKSIIQFAIIDILFLIDIVFMLFDYKYKKIKVVAKRSFLKGAIALIASFIVILGLHISFDIKDISEGKIEFFKVEWAQYINMNNLGPIGFHIYEASDTYKKLTIPKDEAAIKDIDNWLKYNNENLPDNQYKAMFKDKNVVFLQIESLENFVVGREVFGQTITPNLNKLIENSLYFNNIYEQNNGANSIDCDVLVNGSVFTLGESITALTNPETKYNSFPYVLGENGYHTVSTHIEKGSDWGFGELHSNGLGVKEIWDIREYKKDEYAGFGLSDRTTLTQFHEKLTKIPQPFYGVISTLTSHGPFDIQDKYRSLKLPEWLDENYLGGYFQSINYTDKQIGMFISLLEESGLMENTVVVIYGDHSGVHKYYNDKIQDLPLEGDWWRNYEKKIPLIIYGKDSNGQNIKGRTLEVHGGHVDIAPTLLYLLGIEDSYYKEKVMGRILVNTNRDATVIKGNEIIGIPKDKQEEEHLKNAYNIGEKIIKNRYFN